MAERLRTNISIIGFSELQRLERLMGHCRFEIIITGGQRSDESIVGVACADAVSIAEDKQRAAAKSICRLQDI
jgi:hypothetical protein